MNNNYEMIKNITITIKSIIIQILNNKLEYSDIDNDTPLFLSGLGLDSIDLLQLIPQIEKQFGIKIGVKNHNVLKTVNYLAEYIFEKLAEKK